MEPLPPLRDRTIQRVLRRNLEQRPNRPALSDAEVLLSHEELWVRVSRCAGGLREHGIGEGDLVLLMLDNSVDSFVVYAALSFLGATSVPTNTAFKGAVLKHMIENSGCRAVVIEAAYTAALPAEQAHRFDKIIVRGLDGDPAEPSHRSAGSPLVDLRHVLSGPSADPLDLGPEHIVSVMYTSGTTGPSKGALTTQAGAFSICWPPHIIGPNSESTVMLVVAPMFHALGLFGGVYGPLIEGARAHIEERFSASQFWDRVEKVGATRTALVGSMAEFLMRQPARTEDSQHTLQRAYITPRPPWIGEFMTRFNVSSSISFGSTESGVIIHNVAEDQALSLSIGKARPGFDIRLVGPDDLPVPEGEPGECVVRPDEPWVMSPGYLNNPAATADLWRNGWFHTGDLLRKDADGWYYFVDRLKDSIRRRGENISSIEVELEVLAQPDVVECAAVGVGDSKIDQEVKIEVVVAERSTLTEADLIRFLIDRLPYYAVPRYVRFVPDYPRTPTGKIRKVELRSLTPDTWDRESAGIVVQRPTRRH